jgi:exosome complex RNA-binding protein Rrp42 (RNase PH superfamily)
VRADGRTPYQTRPVLVDFGPNDFSVTVAFGESRMLATLRAELEEVHGLGLEGRLIIDVKFSPMASTGFDAVCFP